MPKEGYTGKMREVEKKYLVDNKEKLMNYLADARFVREKHEKDIYFDTSLGDLNSRGHYIRIRNNKSFDFKYDLGEDINHEFCEEVNFEYPLKHEDLENINHVLRTLSLNEAEKADVTDITQKNNLVPLIPIEKHREYYEKNGLTFCVDEVKDLGSFVEIEKIVSEDKIEEALSEIKKEASRFNFRVVPTGYIELYLKRFVPEAYERGRFKVPDDVWK